MKRTQWIVLTKNIGATLVSFLSVVMFVALGIAVFLGIKWNKPAFIGAADDYYNEKCLYDFTATFPYGITDEDIQKLTALDEVSQVEGGYTADGLTWVSKNCSVLAILSNSQTMNYAMAVDGSMPAAADEIAIERGMADVLGLGIGDTFSIHAERGGKPCLNNASFTITGIVEHPAYVNNGTSYSRGGTTIGDGELDFYVVVSESAFNKEAYDNCYSTVYVRCDCLRQYNSFSDEYLSRSEEIAEKLSELGDTLGAARYNSIVERYQTELDDAGAKISDGEKQLADGESRLKAAEAELAELEKKIANGEIALADAEKKLAAGKKAIDDARRQIAGAESTIAVNRAALTDADAQIAAAESQISSGEAELANANAQYQAGLDEYNLHMAELEAAKVQIREACQKTNGLLDEISLAFLATPQDFQDAANQNFQELGFNPITFRLSSEPAELQSQLDELQRVYAACTAYPSERITKLEALQNQITSYQAQYGDAADSPEKQAALEALHAALAAEQMDDEDLGIAAQLVQEELDMLRNDSVFYLPVLNDKIATLKSLQRQIAAYQTKYGAAADSPEKQAALDALHAALATQSLDNPDLDVAAEMVRGELTIYTTLRNLLIEADSSLRDSSAKIAEYLAGEAKLIEANAQLQAAAKAIADNTALLEAGKKTLAERKAEVATGHQQLESAQAQLDAAKQKLAGSVAQWSAGQSELEKNRTALANGKAQIVDGQDALAQSRTTLQNGKAELEASRNAFESAKTGFSSIVFFDRWTIHSRADNFGYSVTDSFSKSGEKLCYSLSLLFVFVGVMVCYTAISRIVKEQRVLAGVQKSLGFRPGEITAQYLSYAVLAVLLGSVLGGLLAYFVIEPIMNHSFAPNFLMGEFKTYFRLKDLVVISAVEMLLIGFSAWIACHKLLSKRAITLLSGNDETVGRTHFYENLRVWNKLSLYTQTTVNNLVNDKTRVIATLVGVAGCTSLIIMALTVQMALVNTPKKHFSQVCVYNQRLVTNDEVPDAMDAMAAVLATEPVSYTEVYQKNVAVQDETGEFTAATLVVPSDAEALPEYLRLTNASGKKPLSLPDEGVLISHTYANRYGLHKGDHLTLVDMSGHKYETQVAGINAYHLASLQLVMSPAGYEKLTGAAAINNTFFINLNGADAQALDAKLKEVPGYFALSDDNTRWTAVFKTYQSSVSLMVYISLFLSALMALLVILNLNIVMIDEKAKELIVMRINGYSVAAAKRYIYRDNIVLTLLGTAIGVLVGMGLGALVIVSMNTKSSNLILDVSPTACLAGAAVSILFSLITNLIALRRVGKLRVSDLNK